MDARGRGGGDSRWRDVLQFWFGDHADDVGAIAHKSASWFAKDAAFDASIGARFGALREAAIAGELDAWLGQPHARLALVILVDQFSRNLFRDDARAFAHDALARRWCEEALIAGIDRSLRPIERVFLYLPLEHSESLVDQQRSVALFADLRDALAEPAHKAFEGFLDYARRHCEIIARFGRFPHRNAALGRVSTAAERAFLEQPGAGF